MKNFAFCVWRSHAKALALFSLVLLATEVRALPAEGGAPVSDDATVMTINELPVSVAEYRLVMQRRTAEVAVFFKQTQNRDDGPGYWHDDGTPVNPIRKLRELVQAELVRIKVIQGLGLRKGLLADAGYGAFAQKLGAENVRRKQAVAANQVIYGPRQYREVSYYYILIGELDHRLQLLVSQEPGRAVSEDDVARYYDARKDKLGDKTLADVRDKITDLIRRENYERFLQELRATAKVEVNMPVLNTLEPRVD